MIIKSNYRHLELPNDFGIIPQTLAQTQALRGATGYLRSKVAQCLLDRT